MQRGPDAPLVLVTGATGAVGPAVVRRALDEGYRVRTLSRHGAPPALLPSATDARVGDVRDADAVDRVLSEIDYVLHLAAVLHRVGTSPEETREYAEINASATRTLVDRAVARGVQRIVLFSTICVYGEERDVVADEETAPAPDTPYARTKLEAERIVLDQAKRDGRPLGVVLRLAAVYGPRLRGNYRTMVRHLAQGRPMPVRPGGNQRTLVFDEDAAAAAVLALRHPAAAGRVYNVTDGSTHSVRDMTDAICAALGRRPPRVGVPASVLRGAVQMAARTRVPPIVRLNGMLEKYTQNISVDGSRLRRELGFVPRVGLAEGWRRTVAGLRRDGVLIDGAD